jgi:carboxyl-terminal processing protease
MMASLGDPHTVFFEPRLAENFAVETTGNFEGIGARLQPNGMGAKIVTVFRDGPADRAGVKGGDIIISVDGESVAGVNVDDIVSKVRGPAKTRVILGISREGESQPLSITVPRGRVVVPNVEDKMIADGTVGYISIAQFSDAVSQQFDESIERVRRENPDGIVIDLRGNPGGLLERTAEMLGRFEEGATVVTMRKRDGQPEVVRSPRGRSLRWEMPVVILINEASASASEIFAGVLHDYNRATLIGEHTYGKASVQQVYPIRGGSGAKVTIARYYLPKSSDISRRVDEDGQYISGGLAPDIELELDLKPGGSLGDEKSDNQLARAIEFIQKGR